MTARSDLSSNWSCVVAPAAEFSHSVAVDPWPVDDIRVDLLATAEEREALRARFDLVDLPSLSASVVVTRRSAELALKGEIEAVVTQTCVVTLEPVTSSLRAPFERLYRPRAIHEKMVSDNRDVADLEDEIDIEVLDGANLDVGEIVAEELCLALDPYPRSAQADRALEDLKEKAGPPTDERAPNPFEKLRKH